MLWLIVVACVLVALVVIALVLTILRFNQLSMARSLCDEAKRQLIVELRARHALVPAFIGTLGQITGSDLSRVELALASAERAPFDRRGAAAENALTEAINAAARIPGTRADKTLPPESTLALGGDLREELDTTVALLHGQLTVLTERILAGSRLYNTNVERYHRQRRRFLSRLFQGVFRARELFTEAREPGTEAREPGTEAGEPRSEAGESRSEAGEA